MQKVCHYERRSELSTDLTRFWSWTIRRIDNDRSSNPNRGRAGLKRAQLELSVIESQLRLRGLLE